jgi:RNA:NAD 2'-phosphotransferase (TPT1/KptA family)
MRYAEIMTEAAEPLPAVLYHATYRPYLRKIKAEGLHGNNSKKNYEDSQPGVVYLATTSVVALSYAETSDEVPEEYLDQIVMLRIATAKLDVTKLRSDRNVIDGTDTVEYAGTIPPDAISLTPQGSRALTEAAKIPRTLQHFTSAANVPQIRREGLKPGGDGFVHMADATDPAGPWTDKDFPSAQMYVIHINTRHPSLRDHQIERHPYPFAPKRRSFTTSVVISPEALSFE